MITPRQLCAARALAGVEQKDVAQGTGLSVIQISRIERGEVLKPHTDTIEKLISFYESLNVKFTDDNGVKEHSEAMRKLNGEKGFHAFLDDVYWTAKNEGGEFCISNVNETNWQKWAGKKKWKEHNERMNEIKDNFFDKIIICEGDENFLASDFAEYRWMPEALFNEKTLYAYGNKLAFLNFTDYDVEIFIIQQQGFADGFRVLFNEAWHGTNIIRPNEEK